MPDMRFAPAPVILANANGSGLNQTDVRSHNERLLMDLLRREGTLSRFDIGQRTGLSAQTVSVLVRALLKEGFLLEEEISRGRVGPPTTPFSLNPNGAFAIGIYAGVRIIDLCLLDLRGGLRATQRIHRDENVDIATQIVDLAKPFFYGLPPRIRNRCLGMGLGVNPALWNQTPGAGQGDWQPGSGLHDVEEALTAATELECYILDDTINAATGQVLYGGMEVDASFLYIHIGVDTRARVVLNGQAQPSRKRELGAMPGLTLLEEKLREVGCEASGIWMGDPIPDVGFSAFHEWAQNVADHLATTSLGLLPYLDLSQIVLATALPETETETIATDVSRAIHNGGADVRTLVAHNSQWAKASGAAARVLSSRFTQDGGAVAAVPA